MNNDDFIEWLFPAFTEHPKRPIHIVMNIVGLVAGIAVVIFNGLLMTGRIPLP